MCPGGCGWDGFDPSIHLTCDGTDGPVAPWDDDWDDAPLDDPADDPCYAGEDCLVHNGGFAI